MIFMILAINKYVWFRMSNTFAFVSRKNFGSLNIKFAQEMFLCDARMHVNAYMCTQIESQENPLYTAWMRARRNHKLKDRNDHSRIKEALSRRSSRTRQTKLPRNCKGSRSEYVTREARRWAMRRRSPLRPHGRRALCHGSCITRGEGCIFWRV